MGSIGGADPIVRGAQPDLAELPGALESQGVGCSELVWEMDLAMNGHEGPRMEMDFSDQVRFFGEIYSWKMDAVRCCPFRARPRGGVRPSHLGYKMEGSNSPDPHAGGCKFWGPPVMTCVVAFLRVAPLSVPLFAHLCGKDLRQGFSRPQLRQKHPNGLHAELPQHTNPNVS